MTSNQPKSRTVLHRQPGRTRSHCGEHGLATTCSPTSSSALRILSGSGQRQKWFAMRFVGCDRDIDFAARSSEFSHWRWAPPATIGDLVVPFKRRLYRDVPRQFDTERSASIAMKTIGGPQWISRNICRRRSSPRGECHH